MVSEMTLWGQLSITFAGFHILEVKQMASTHLEATYVPGTLCSGSSKCYFIYFSQGSRKVNQIIPGIHIK